MQPSEKKNKALISQPKVPWNDLSRNLLLAVFVFHELTGWFLDLALVCKHWHAAVKSAPRGSNFYRRASAKQFIWSLKRLEAVYGDCFDFSYGRRREAKSFVSVFASLDIPRGFLLVHGETDLYTVVRVPIAKVALNRSKTFPHNLCSNCDRDSGDDAQLIGVDGNLSNPSHKWLVDTGAVFFHNTVRCVRLCRSCEPHHLIGLRTVNVHGVHLIAGPPDYSVWIQ